MTIGSRIKKLREERNISQETMSYEINVSRQTISKWENDSVLPDSNNISVLCKYFDVSADYLINGKESKHESINEKPRKASIIIHSIGIVVGIVMFVFGILFEAVPAFRDSIRISGGSSFVIIPTGYVLIVAGLFLFIYCSIKVSKYMREL